MNLYLYLLSQDQYNGYDTYDSCVVCAADPDAARLIHPAQDSTYQPKNWAASGWANAPEQINCKLIGTAEPGMEPGVICASFNAG